MGVIGRLVVDHFVGAEGSNEIELATPRHASDMCSARLTDLDGVWPHVARSPDYEQPLACFEFATVPPAQRLHGQDPGVRQGRRIRVRQAVRDCLEGGLRAATNSANDPPPMDPAAKRSVKTRSPGLKRVTPSPTRSTTPATSKPSCRSRGRRIPSQTRLASQRG